MPVVSLLLLPQLPGMDLSRGVAAAVEGELRKVYGCCVQHLPA
jgi:hypothetical protein